MSQASLSADDAWQWIVSGWRTFMKKPGMWIVLALAYVVLLFLLNLAPLIGALVAALSMPALIAGMLQGVREVEAGRKLEAAHLFHAFRDQAKLVQLALLGVVPLAVTLLQKALVSSPMPELLAALIGLFLSLASACALLYGIPLIMFGNKQAAEAVPSSLRACLAQPLAVGVFLGLAVLLAIAAAIPLGLGLLVYLPVMVAAMHASYRQVI
jgi:uncharacterized membrane protein